MYTNLTVGKKLLIAFGTILTFFVLTAGLAMFAITAISSSLNNFYDQPYQAMQASKEIEGSLQSIAKDMMSACAVTDQKVMEERLTLVEQKVATYKSDLALLQTTFTGDKAVLTRVSDLTTSAEAVRAQIVELIRSGKLEQAAALYISDYTPALDGLLVELEAIEKTASDAGLAFKDQSDRIQRNTTIFFICVTVLCLGWGISLGIRTTRSIKRPIQELRYVANELAQGNLKAIPTYQSRDEMGQLSDAMRTTVRTLDAYIGDISKAMEQLSAGNLNIKPEVEFHGDFIHLRDSILHTVHSFNDTLTQINVSSEQVATSSEQVSAGAQALSQGASEQSHTLQTLTGTVEEISDQVRSNAENANEGRAKVGRLSDEIVTSNQHMQEMIAAMGEISSTSNEISKIIKTIEDIAFQTNILALNAAVEAARAGAAGKGFAVVADEVRNLASKSAEASKNTSALIEGSIRAVGNGTQIADATAMSLQSVVAGARDVTESIDRISAASSEQATSIVQVTEGIEQISMVVQQNSATSEQSAAASEELSSQAVMLKEMVGRFKLIEGSRTSTNLESPKETHAQLSFSSGSKY